MPVYNASVQSERCSVELIKTSSIPSLRVHPVFEGHSVRERAAEQLRPAHVRAAAAGRSGCGRYGGEDGSHWGIQREDDVAMLGWDRRAVTLESD